MRKSAFLQHIKRTHQIISCCLVGTFCYNHLNTTVIFACVILLQSKIFTSEDGEDLEYISTFQLKSDTEEVPKPGQRNQ